MKNLLAPSALFVLSVGFLLSSITNCRQNKRIELLEGNLPKTQLVSSNGEQ